MKAPVHFKINAQKQLPLFFLNNSFLDKASLKIALKQSYPISKIMITVLFFLNIYIAMLLSVLVIINISFLVEKDPL